MTTPSKKSTLRDLVALSLVPGMGPVSFKKLSERFGDARTILSCAAGDFAPIKKGFRFSWEALRAPDLLSRADDEIQKAAKQKITIITLEDERYPLALREIHDPPILLYVKGKLPSKDRIHIGVVGSRGCSLYGRKMATEIACDLASAGLVVTSGLALGIDTAAHQGALQGKGITCAVLGGGIGKLYPKENKKLADQIVERGALISEYPIDMEPEAGFFPIRNRIISGLSRGVLVVEAKEKSGALITADSALEQGREVFAVPGNADSSKSLGTNGLLRQGARLTLSAEDILTELGLTFSGSSKHSLKLKLTPEEEKMFLLLEAGAVQLEELVEASGFSLQKAASVLSYLEMKGAVQQTPGKYFQKK